MIIGLSGYIGSGKDTVGPIIQYLTSGSIKKGRSFETFLERHNNSEAFGNWYWSDWRIKKFAYKLKQIASILTGIPQEKFEDQEFKKTFLSDDWNILDSIEYPEYGKQPTGEEIMNSNSLTTQYNYKRTSVREFLQKLGTDAIRDNLHPNTWVNALFADYKTIRTGWKNNENEWDNSHTDAWIEPNWIITDCRFPNEAEAIKDRGGIIVRINRVIFPRKDGAQLQLRNLHPSETALDNWNFDYKIENNGTVEELTEKVKSLLEELKIL